MLIAILLWYLKGGLMRDTVGINFDNQPGLKFALITREECVHE